VDHARTSFPLKGLHAAVQCAKCHARPAMQVKLQAATCAACHADPHRGTFKQDCASCHNESGFMKGAFDHSTTTFPLIDRHAGLTCISCHKAPVGSAAAVAAARGVVPISGRGRPASARGLPPVAATPADFRGLRTACVSCHSDVHQGELGTRCESCHSARTFAVSPFTHANQRAFFAGGHAALSCARCHVPGATVTTPTASIAPGKPVPIAAPRMAHVGLTSTSDACVSCHEDVHAGQLGTACETCHAVNVPKFTVAAFAHEKTKFPLTGRHAPLQCAECHKVETGAYPGGTATARHFTGLGTECASCHQDRHAGQLTQGCQTCHTTDTFAVSQYRHVRARALSAFFTGRHVTPKCSACHKPIRTTPVAAAVKAGPAVVQANYRVGTTCTDCHADAHKGGLGPRCETCHKP
jgi:hypothetical protein